MGFTCCWTKTEENGIRIGNSVIDAFTTSLSILARLMLTFVSRKIGPFSLKFWYVIPIVMIETFVITNDKYVIFLEIYKFLENRQNINNFKN